METASDYLLEYINDSKCSDWMRKVIETFLQKSPDDHIDELAEDLLEISVYTVASEDAKQLDTNNDVVVLKELIHKTGVNALAENQKIKFNSQVNVIYGLNGTGKSSYFRILNEMLGGDNDTPIRSNIYVENAKPISVEIKYSYRGTDRTISWDGNRRGLSDLKSMRVFDSAYTRDLLKKRNSDELVVKPYGLFIFADLISFIDQIVERANEIISDKENKRPQINTKDMICDIACLFNGERVSESSINILKQIFASTEVKDELLEKKKNEVDNLRVGNPKDKITILNSKVTEADRLVKRIEDVMEKGNDFIETVQSGIKSYHDYKTQSEEHKKKLEILQDIPGTDTKVWQEFISKGIDYSNEQALDEECPFCHQKYSDHAKDIVSAYVSFLDNKSQVELGNTEKKLALKKIEIENWNVLGEIDEEKWDSALLEQIRLAMSDIENVRALLLTSLENKKVETIEKIDLGELVVNIKTYMEEMKKLIEDLSVESEDKNRALQQAETEYSTLKSNFSIKKQQGKIEEIIEIESWIGKRKEIIADISNQRKKISTLSKKAHNELLTVQLQDEFNRKLKELGVKNVEIELQGKNNNGVQQTELTIRKNRDITSILSEGEQKATALALYLSEISLSQNKSTIIFDDPVNSLDHRMMQALADLLMNIDNQIIVFTHNKMFLDCFECSEYGHICKGINSACSSTRGKHIYLYETQSEGKNKKGVIVEKRAQKLSNYIKDLEILLAETPFTKFDEAGVKLRRGVETAIDEVVFNNQTPTKLSNKKSHIQWDELKNMCNDAELIDGLHQIHGRASGGELHNGSEREENPLDRDEIEELYEKLKNLCHIA